MGGVQELLHNKDASGFWVSAVDLGDDATPPLERYFYYRY